MGNREQGHLQRDRNLGLGRRAEGRAGPTSGAHPEPLSGNMHTQNPTGHGRDHLVLSTGRPQEDPTLGPLPA